MGSVMHAPGLAPGQSVTAAILIASAWVPAGLSGQNQTGFLDRSVAIDGVEYPYQVYVPRDYDATRSWPVILFLHGAGERGEDGLIQTEVGIGSAIRRTPDRYPAVVVLPQVPLDSTWQGAPGRAAMGALDRTIEEFNTDSTRVYLTGMSMGGNGTWYLAYQHPDRFAAIAPICGFVSSSRLVASFVPDGEGSAFERLAERIRHIPTWIVHGDADDVVPVLESRSMHDALRAAGAAVHYVELPGVGHNSWDTTYQTPELATWLFTQRR
jgi:predicted peptidase